MKKFLIIFLILFVSVLPVSAASYTSYYNSPFGLNYLAGDIMPWEDYIIFRDDNYTSIAVYGQADENGVFETATVRRVIRDSDYGGSYTTSETTESNVSVNVTEPYYIYSNLYGVGYALPSNENVMSIVCVSAFALTVLISVFRLVWSFRKGVAK